jgi:hypothetical protein
MVMSTEYWMASQCYFFGNMAAMWRHGSITAAISTPAPRKRSIKWHATIPPIFVYSTPPPPPPNAYITRITINNFATRSLILQRFLLNYVYSLKRKNTQQRKNLCSTREPTAKLFIRRKFLSSACNVWTFPLHQSNTSLLKYTGHCEL